MERITQFKLQELRALDPDLAKMIAACCEVGSEGPFNEEERGQLLEAARVLG